MIDTSIQQALEAQRTWTDKSTPWRNRPHSYRAYHAYDHEREAFDQHTFRCLRKGIPVSLWQFAYWKEIDLQWAEHQIAKLEVRATIR